MTQGEPRACLSTDLDGFHGVVLVQFVDVVGDAGIERGGGDGVYDGGVVGLLLVALAVGVDEQRDQATKNGAAETHCDHVEKVEIWKAEWGGISMRLKWVVVK